MKHPLSWQRFLLPAFSLFWLALILLSLFGPSIYTSGLILAPDGSNALQVVSVSSPALERAGVRPGTVIDRGRLSYADLQRVRGSLKGTLIRIPVRIGDTTHVVIARADVPFRPKNALEVWFECVTLTFSLALCGYLGYRRPGIMIAALILFIAGSALSWPTVAAMLSALPDVAYTAIVWPLSVLCSIFPTLVLASFAIRLPNDEAHGSPKKRTAIWAIDAMVILGLALEAIPYGRFASHLYIALSAVVVIVASALSLRLAQPSDRSRVGIVFVAVMLGGVGYAIDIFIESFTGPTAAFYVYSTISTIMVPVSVTYAILRHRVFDIAFVLNRTLVYALTSALVLVVLAALEFLAERYLTALTHVEGVVLEFVIALLVIVSARMIHQRIDRLVDTVLFRTRHQQESALQRFALEAQFYTAEEPLIRDAVDALVRYGRVQGAAVYLNGGATMQRAASTFEMAAEKVDQNDAAFVALRAHRDEIDTHEYTTAFPGARLYPMVLAGRLAGAMATGERESGELMPPDIDEAIRRIASAVSISLAAIESDRIRVENATLLQRLNAAAISS